MNSRKPAGCMPNSSTKALRNMAGRKLKYYGSKVLIFLVSVIVLSMAVFTVSRLTPMDPLQAYYGDRTEKMTVQEKEVAREKLGLNDSIPVQYGKWVSGALQGDFGISYEYKQPVGDVIGGRVINTLLLGGLGLILTFAGALAIGLFCARRENTIADRAVCKLGTVSSCIPEFWLAILLIFLFGVVCRIFPTGNAYSLGNESNILDRLYHLALPLTVVVLGHLWYYGYMIRNMLLQEARSGYVLLCKAKGLDDGAILRRHCLRNIMPELISVVAVSVPHILGGTYIVEMVFAYPGIGSLSYESARYSDYNMLMVLCMLTGIIVIASNMAGQVLSERIDPRVRAGEKLWEVEHE